LEQEALWRQTVETYQYVRNPFLNPPHVGLGTVIPVLICPSDDRIDQPQISRGFLVACSSFLGNSGVDLRTRDGVLYRDSSVRLADIADGVSFTLLAGERPPSPDLYYGWWYAGAGQRVSGSCNS